MPDKEAADHDDGKAQIYYITPLEQVYARSLILISIHLL